jgi:ABC-type polysaccharide/polyol phosphate transport system ATPase subunit
MKNRIRSDNTVVIVSHHVDLIADLCDRVVWIDRGKVVEVGETQGVLQAFRQSTLPASAAGREKG